MKFPIFNKQGSIRDTTSLVTEIVFPPRGYPTTVTASLITLHVLHPPRFHALLSHLRTSPNSSISPSCQFDHPMGTLSYSPSTSSLADMPVAPYPVGSSKGTLAPSSSSSELRPEFMSGSHKDAPALSTRMSSSMSSSSGSVGSVFSKSSSTSHQASAPSAASSSMSQGVNAFQRVKIDKVEFANERLQNNSYWAKDSAKVGYGAKAQEILGQVKGRWNQKLKPSPRRSRLQIDSMESVIALLRKEVDCVNGLPCVSVSTDSID